MTHSLAAQSLIEITPKHWLDRLVMELKNCFLEGRHYDDYFTILWHCAQNMSYPIFWKAWNGEHLETEELLLT